MTRWKPVTPEKLRSPRPPRSPWRLQATELVDEIVATARWLAAARHSDDEPVLPTDARWEVLGLVEGAQRSQSIADLARSLGTSRQNAREVLLRAARAGYVELVPHPRDRRTILVELTPRGSGALAASRARLARWVIVMLNGLESREIRSVVRVLQIIRHRVRRDERARESSGRPALPRVRPR